MHDPHLAYRAGKEGVFPLRFQAGRALWRDSTTYLLHRGNSAGGHAPHTLNWLSRRTLRQLGTGQSVAFAVDVFGLVNDQAKVELWRHERAAIYPAIIDDTDRWQTLKELLDDRQSNQDDATKRAERLRQATWAFAMRARLHNPWGTKMLKVENNECDAFVQMLDTDSRYWLTLGGLFDTYLARIATVPLDELAQVRTDWQRAIRLAAKRALYDALISLATTASTRQALAEAETVLQFGTLYPKTAKPSLSQV